MSDNAPRVTITHHVQGQGGCYSARVEGEQASGVLEWEPASSEEDVRIATHTIVPRAIGGRGIAGMLVERLIADARKQGFRVVPKCSYVAKKFDDNPEWGHLRA